MPMPVRFSMPSSLEDVFLLRAKLVQIRRELDGDVADRIIEESAAR